MENILQSHCIIFEIKSKTLLERNNTRIVIFVYLNDDLDVRSFRKTLLSSQKRFLNFFLINTNSKIILGKKICLYCNLIT